MKYFLLASILFSTFFNCYSQQKKEYDPTPVKVFRVFTEGNFWISDNPKTFVDDQNCFAFYILEDDQVNYRLLGTISGASGLNNPGFNQGNPISGKKELIIVVFHKAGEWFPVPDKDKYIGHDNVRITCLGKIKSDGNRDDYNYINFNHANHHIDFVEWNKNKYASYPSIGNISIIPNADVD